MRRTLGLLLTAAVLVSAPAAAQDHPVTVNVGGGLTGIFGPGANIFGNGFGNAGHLIAGVYVKVRPLVWIGGEYGWHGLPTKTTTFTVTPTPVATPHDGAPAQFSITGSMQYGDVNVMVQPDVPGRIAPYFIGGVGAYYRPVTAAAAVTGYVDVCDPALYICSPTPTSIDQVIGTRSSTDVGVNVGGGVTFTLTRHVGAFFEARYHFIRGPSIAQQNVPAGMTLNAVRANGEFLPITFGFRF